MESPRKNNDCYFYYYSTCTKGDSCTFRHEPSALGCETTCSFWKEGKCFNVQCNFRHMELRKNRKVIPCYWETQPGGCLKPHCPFLHQNPKHLSHSENQGEASDLKTQEINKQSALQKTDSCAKNASQGNEKSFGNPVVDPLVVNFEEESDNESAPTQSPVKTSRSVNVKTLEEIRLEKIQAESAAYYSYSESTMSESGDDLRERIVRRINMKQNEKKKDFNILCLNEIRKKKRVLSDVQNEDDNVKRPRILSNKGQMDISEVKIKTLDEIRAERAKRIIEQQIPVTSSNEIGLCNASSDIQSSEESEVTSTSKTEERKDDSEERSRENLHVAKVHPIKRLKRSRSNDSEHKPKLIKLSDGTCEELTDREINVKENPECDKLNVTDSMTELEINLSTDYSIGKDEIQPQDHDMKDVSEKLVSDSSRLDEVLLLDVEDFDESDAIKAEEDILKDIDNLLNE